MDLFLQPPDITSPPSTPPYRPLQRQRSSYILDSSILDKGRSDYISQVKNTFQHLTFQQRHYFLQEILSCCDNQLLQYIYTFITPKLKIDFLKELPIELSLHVVSFIDDPQTLARASLVSKHWNSLLKDEGAWKSLCVKHNYVHAAPSYRRFFRRQYHIETAWRHGRGQVTTCGQNQIGEGLATSLQMNDQYIVIGCDNHQIHVFDARQGQFIRSLEGHEGGVWALQFIKHGDQSILVTGGCDRVAIVWNLATGEKLHVLRGHTSTIRCLKVKETLAVTGSRDATLRIWNIETGELQHVCMGHQSSVRCLDIAGNLVASGSYDNTARLWNMETGERLHEFVGHHSQIYSISCSAERVVTGSLDSNIRVWSALTGECIATLQGHTSLVGHVQLSHHRLVSGGSDGCLRIWDMETFECKHRISAHDNSVTCLQHDDKRILSGGSDGKVKLWDIETGTLIRTFTQSARTVWKIQLNDTKAVVILQRDDDEYQTSSHHTVIELHNFDANADDIDDTLIDDERELLNKL